MTTVAELLIESLADHGVTQVWGVVGDALNPVTDAIRRDERVEWIGVRHEEVAAFAAGAQAQLSGRIGVCMGTVGPGAIHLLNGLYDAKKSHAPLLAICGQVPREDIGSDFFQEVDNDALFADVSVFAQTVVSAEQFPAVLEQAVNAALEHGGVSVLTLPGDVGDLELPKHTRTPRFVEPDTRAAPSSDSVRAAADALNSAGSVALLVGQGARNARAEVLALAETLNAPMVLSLKAKEGLERDNRFEVGQSGLIGNPASRVALEGCETLFLIGTDFPYRDFLPEGKTVIQLDRRSGNIGRRLVVDRPLVGDCELGLAALIPLLDVRSDDSLLVKSRATYENWRTAQARLTDPDYERKPVGLLRRKVDNPESRIRPELLAAAVGRHASSDAVFTTDTGMATVWLSRFVRMSGTRRLLGSFNLGSMANAMPQALGAAALDTSRQVVAFCGDGGLSMLMGDLITAVTYELPVKLIVFDNARLGMVKLEMEQVGLPEFGTVLHNPDFAEVARAVGLHGVRVEDPSEVDDAVRALLAVPGPALLDVVTNPDEIAIPPKPTLAQGWGFAIAKTREFVESPE
ncbi:Thiamine pyrophosphate protein TPP binding domain-containing protein [metagenome]|uniref:Thiamine pyrophosphate protein TPP binding domain-containing protein n=1 Tax=metagenome TaxID=256318 RepID=A0A2P2C2G1_9ZZZZ